MTYLIPHTQEWFKALKASSPAQAAMTKQIIQLAGSEEVCSVCGDDSTMDYKIVGAKFGEDVDATIRLCEGCCDIRSKMHGEKFEKL